MKRIRIASMLVLVLLAAAIAQAAPPAIPQGWSKYILILNDASFRPARGHVAVAAPDIPQLGGKVLQQWGRRFSVALPPGLAATLRDHPAVRELQRVYTGAPLPEEVPPSVLRLQSTAMHGAPDSAPPTWSSGEYVYDGSGNIKNIGWGTGTTLNGDGKSNTYVYDTAGRLVSATANYAVDGTETYTYDAFGNMISVTHNGQTSSFAIDSGSNRLQGVLYDLAGNLVNDGTQWYGYDALNMLRQQSGFREGEAYIYTADDERIGTDENISIRWTIRDFGGNVLREFDGLVDSDWSFVKDYVYRDGQLLASHGEMADGSTLIHYHLDHLGTPRLVTTQNKRRITQDDYFPFGTEQTSLSQATTVFGFESELTHRFTGHERNFLGDPSFEDVPYIDYMHARYYNPKMGRFLSVDPEIGNPHSPQSWNGYSYVLNNPMIFVDPTGRVPICKWIGGATEGHWECLESVEVDAKDPGPEPSTGPFIYHTRDEAARAAVESICGESISKDKEYEGEILKKGNRFGFSTPRMGNQHDTGKEMGQNNFWDGPNFMKMLPPPGTRLVGTYHTHGAESGRGDESISDNDIRAASLLKLAVYVGTPEGRVRIYDPRDFYIRNPDAEDFGLWIGTVQCK